MYTIIDIETTGGNKTSGRITEIAAFLHDGHKLIDSFVSLINPETPIPPFIRNLTGISDEMVADAPKFAEIAEKLDRFTANSIFVAHNVNFDYHFLREEFKKTGREFSRRKLCTVQLSRRTFPGLPSYSLGKLTKQLNIKLDGHHRAEADAKATLELFEKILSEQPGQGLFDTSFGLDEIASLNSPLIDKELLMSIPDECGVFRLFDKDDKLIYIKRSSEILNALSSKLRRNGSQISHDLIEEVYRIDWTHTGSLLAAQLIEANEVLEFKPKFNYGKFSMKAQFGLVYEEKENTVRFILKKRRTGQEQVLVYSNFYEGFDHLKVISERLATPIKSSGSERFKDHFLEFPKSSIEESNVLLGLTGESFWLIDEGQNIDERVAIRVDEGFPTGMGIIIEDGFNDLPQNEIFNYRFNPYPELEMILRTFVAKNRFEAIKQL